MQCKSFLVLAAMVASSALAAPSPLVVKESVAVPDGWVKRADLSPAGSDKVTMRIGLARRNMPKLESRLMELGDPSHPDFRQWLTKEQVDAYLAPAPETKRAVESWLAAHDVTVSKRSSAGDYVSFETTYAKARAMLGDASFHTYEHRSTGERIVRTTEFSLPRDLHEHVELVSPSTNFGSGLRAQSAPHLNNGWVIPDAKHSGSGVSPLTVGTPLNHQGKQAPEVTASPQGSGAAIASQSSVPPDCILTYTTRACIQELYHTPNDTIQAPGKSFIGIGSYLGEIANHADQRAYEQSQLPAAYENNYRFTTKILNGANNNQSEAAAGAEADLDTQAVLLAYPIPTTVYNTGGNGDWMATPSTPTNTNEDYTALFEYLLAQPDGKLPSVLSNSYDDDESSVAYSYAARVCKDIAALTARGTTLVFSSGDYGVGPDNTCTIHGRKQFLPNFPSTCPYGLSVGATQKYAPEEAVGDDVAGFYSGGGFSNYFAQPQYQAEQVNAYVKTLDPALTPYYNASGRAFPDVAAQGSRYLVNYMQGFYAIGGTSASAPTFSAVLALINDALIAKGLQTLGFANPFFYQLGGEEGLNDITSGSSAGCSELGSPANKGFPAAKGFDAVTGLGTPNYPALARAAGADI